MKWFGVGSDSAWFSYPKITTLTTSAFFLGNKHSNFPHWGPNFHNGPLISGTGRPPDHRTRAEKTFSRKNQIRGKRVCDVDSQSLCSVFFSRKIPSQRNSQIFEVHISPTLLQSSSGPTYPPMRRWRSGCCYCCCCRCDTWNFP